MAEKQRQKEKLEYSSEKKQIFRLMTYQQGKPEVIEKSSSMGK